MHHRLDILAEAQDQRRVGEVAGNELGAPRHQMLHRVRTTTADPYRQALLQGEASETPADEARRPVTRIRIAFLPLSFLCRDSSKPEPHHHWHSMPEQRPCGPPARLALGDRSGAARYKVNLKATCTLGDAPWPVTG